MKLSKLSKRIMAFVCAIAMVVATFAYTPSTAKAAGTWIDVPDATLTTVGPWKLWANYAEWAKLAYMENTTDPQNPEDVSIKVVNPTGWYNWNCTAKLEGYLGGRMFAGNTYNISVNVTSNMATGTGKSLRFAVGGVNYDKEISAGTHDYTLATNYTFNGQGYDFVLDMSLLTAGTEFTVNSISFDLVGGWQRVPDDTPTTVGPYSLYANYANWGALAYKTNAQTPTNPGDVSLKLLNPSDHDWESAATLTDYSQGKMVSGNTYTVSMNITSSTTFASGKYLKVWVDGQSYNITPTSGTDDYTIVQNYQYTETNKNISFDFRYVAAGTEITINDITFTETSSWTPVPDDTATTVGPWTLYANYANWGKLAYQTTGNDVGDTTIKVVNPTGSFIWECTGTLDDYAVGKMSSGNKYDISVNITSSAATAANKSLRVWVDGQSYDKAITAGTDDYTIASDYEYTATNPDVAFDFGEMTAGTEITINSITFTEKEAWTPVPNDTQTAVGCWTLYANYANWGKLAYQSTGNNVEDTTIKIVNPTGSFIWECIGRLNNYATGRMTAGHTYNISMSIDASQATASGKSLRIQLDNNNYDKALTSGTNNISVVQGYTYTGSNADIVFDFGELTAGTIITVNSITFTEDSSWTAAIADGSPHTVAAGGYSYQLNSAAAAAYQGGTSISDPLDMKVVKSANEDGDFVVSSPTVSVSAGHYYKLTYNVENKGPSDTGKNIFVVVRDASNDADLGSNWSDKVKVNANSDADIELEYMAPESGSVYFELNNGWTPASEYVLTVASNEDLNPTAQAITPGTWGYAGANNTGWQYYARANGSAYMGGTSMGDDLTINYNTYVNDTYTCIARSPITAVDSAKQYTGAMTITNNSKETIQAGNLHVSVHWYNASTQQDGEISAATSVAIPAGESKTFNLSYTAPDSGYIFYEASTSYTPGKAQYTYSATHTPPADGRYDVAAYKSGSTATYPTESGKIFAGWYDDTSYTQVHSGNTGLAYAKFIDEKVLDVKFQKKNDKTAVRFVSTIDDCLDYTSVGFKFTGDYGAKHIDTEKSCTKVYKNINADGQTLTPSTAFDNTDSAYFFTYSVRNMDGTTSSTWTVTPFYVTPDGTKVYGTTKDYSM